MVWETVEETNLNTDFYFGKYNFILINWIKGKYAQYKCVSCWNKENSVISTNPFAVDAMLPIMAKHADIWTLELVSVQVFHL